MPDNQRTVDDVIADLEALAKEAACRGNDVLWGINGRSGPALHRYDLPIVLAEITRLRSQVAQQQADLRTLAGAVRVWEPAEPVRISTAVLAWDADENEPVVAFWQSVKGVFTGYVSDETGEGLSVRFIQHTPDPPDPTRDEAIAAAVQRALGDA